MATICSLIDIFVAIVLTLQVKASKNELCFSIIGDTGGLPNAPYHTSQQARTATLLAKVTKHWKCRFVMGLGDNFYFNGIKDVHDPRFQLTFEKTYSDPALNIPWYMIAGNHDHLSNVSAQVQYTKLSSRWYYPNFFYTEVQKIPETKKTLQVVMIDTQMLCNYNRKAVFPSPEEQMNWLSDTLSKSRADYLVVGGHHPIHSAGSHGSTGCLHDKLKPLLEKNHVTAYFSGHDHNLQHIKPVHSNVHYFISGSGNFVDPRMPNWLKLPKHSLRFQHGLHGGFIFMKATNNFLEAIMLNNQPRKLYSIKLLPRDINVKKVAKRDLQSRDGDNIEITDIGKNETVSRVKNVIKHDAIEIKSRDESAKINTNRDELLNPNTENRHDIKHISRDKQKSRDKTAAQKHNHAKHHSKRDMENDFKYHDKRHKMPKLELSVKNKPLNPIFAVTPSEIKRSETPSIKFSNEESKRLVQSEVSTESPWGNNSIK